MRKLIEQEYPDHAILGEEYSNKDGNAHCLVLDPVEGAKPSIWRIPVRGTLIGLTKDGIAIRGLMSQPFTGERFWADDTGAWHQRGNGVEPMRSRQSTLADAILHITSPQGYQGSLRDKFDVLKDRVRMTRYCGECYT